MQKVFLGIYSVVDGGYGEDTPKTLDALLAEAKRLGYDGVEFLTGDLENNAASDIKALLEKYAMEAYSAHVSIDRMEALLEKGQEIGLKYFFAPMERIMNAEDALAVASRLNLMAKKAAPYGITVGCHNHAFEFWMEGRKTLEEILIENTDPAVLFQLDCGWAALAGTYVPSFIRRYSGRFAAIHIKENNKVLGPDCPVKMRDSEETRKTECRMGSEESNIDYVEISKALLEQNIEEPLFIVEREYSYSGTRAECLAEDCAWLKAHL